MESIEEIQHKPYNEVCAALAEMAPDVLAARKHYDELAARQRVYVAARELIGAGLRIGDKAQLLGQCAGKADPLAVVVGANSGGPLFQMLGKNGEPHGEPQSAFLFEGFYKI